MAEKLTELTVFNPTGYPPRWSVSDWRQRGLPKPLNFKGSVCAVG